MMQLWMGESEHFGLEDDVTVEEEVQVNDAGTPVRPRRLPIWSSIVRRSLRVSSGSKAVSIWTTPLT